MTANIVLVLLGGLVLNYIRSIVLPPWGFPRNIPTIPFYVTFLTTLFDIDQKELFELYIRKPMEKYGAVKIYFGNRWNILVSKPEFLAQMFKDEDTFAKSGNHIKIPYSILALYTGDNVISSHGLAWKKFRGALTQGLQFFDPSPLSANAEKFIGFIERDMKKNNGEVLMPALIQRLALANIAQIALGFDIGTLDPERPSKLQQQLEEVKKHIFHPLYMNFSFLDRLPIPSRIRARQQVERFRSDLLQEVRRNLIINYKYEQTSYAASDLIRVYEHGEITEKQLTDNIVILMVAGHENPQLLLTTCLYMLAKYPEWQARLRQQAVTLQDDLLNDSVEFNQFLFETVRVLPPLGQIINRKTSHKCKLGPEIVLPKDTYVGYQVYGTGTSTQVWGPDAAEFKPERWGSTNATVHETWRRSKNTGAMGAFHGGRRACLGEKMGLMETRVALAHMLRKLEWTLSPNWKDRVTPAGPLCPFMLKLQFTRIQEPLAAEPTA
ncbi:FAFR400Cp [Eremothecium gossypii FDAG1]|nr:FAFR400Cp [Eremothecium gossypii FDAG1]